MTNPYRIMCAELLAEYEDSFTISEPSDDPLVQRARELLAQPVAEGPTDKELEEEFGTTFLRLSDINMNATAVAFARAVLARFGHPTPQPVAVSERLPGPGDCDEQGRCWLLTVEDKYPQWRLHAIEGAQPGGAMIWVPVDSSPGVMVDCFYTSHWLPANALPTPEDKP